MATLGTGAACCGDPDNCPLGVCDEVAEKPKKKAPARKESADHDDEKEKA